MPDMPVIALPPIVQSRSTRCANPRTKSLRRPSLAVGRWMLLRA